MIGIIRSSEDEATATKAGAHEVVRNDDTLTGGVRAQAPKGVDHIIEVAFGANIEVDLELLNMGESIATYAPIVRHPKSPSGRWCSRTPGYSSWEVTTFQGTQKR